MGMMLTACSDEVDEIVGFNMGEDLIETICGVGYRFRSEPVDPRGD